MQALLQKHQMLDMEYFLFGKLVLFIPLDERSWELHFSDLIKLNLTIKYHLTFILFQI